VNSVHLGVMEKRFAEMIWEREPISSHDLVKLTVVDFGWARTTTHNMIKKLCKKGVFKNNKVIITSVLDREQFYSLQAQQFVSDMFEGELKAFIIAFTKNNKLTQNEKDEIRKSIE